MVKLEPLYLASPDMAMHQLSGFHLPQTYLTYRYGWILVMMSMNKLKISIEETDQARIYTINDEITVIEGESIYSILSKREIEFVKMQDQYYHYILKKA